MTRWILRALLAAVVLSPIATAADVGGKTVPSGTWGGEHVRLVVTEAGATIEYDCAAGTITEPIRPDEQGRFEARGTYVFEQGGPRQAGDPPPPAHPALYRGAVDGTRLRLTVTLVDPRKEVGSFSVELGRPPHLEKCL